MTKLLMCTMLCCSIAGTTLAQIDLRYSSNNINGWNRIEVDFSNKNQLFVSMYDLTDLTRYRNLDSLLSLCLNDFQSLKESLGSSTASRKLVFELKNGKRSMQLFEHPARVNQYQVTDNKEVLQIKTLRDTLIIQQWTADPPTSKKVEEAGHWARYFFILNNLQDIEAIANAKLNPKIEDAIARFTKGPGYTKANLFSKRYSSFLRLSGTEHNGIRDIQVRTRPTLALMGHIGVGVAKGNLYPFATLTGMFITHATHSPDGIKEPNSSVGIFANWQPQFFFGRNTDGQLQTYRNDFVNVGFAISNKNFGLIRSSLSVGYLIKSQGDYYQKNTFRVGFGYSLSKNIALEPELYFHDFLKGISPGLRLSVGF